MKTTSYTCKSPNILLVGLKTLSVEISYWVVIWHHCIWLAAVAAHFFMNLRPVLTLAVEINMKDNMHFGYTRYEVIEERKDEITLGHNKMSEST